MLTSLLPQYQGLILVIKMKNRKKKMPGHHLRALKIVTKKLAPVPLLLLPVLLLVHLWPVGTNSGYTWKFEQTWTYININQRANICETPLAFMFTFTLRSVVSRSNVKQEGCSHHPGKGMSPICHTGPLPDLCPKLRKIHWCLSTRYFYLNICHLKMLLSWYPQT